MAAPAVLDACVLYPVSLRDVLLRCVQAGLFRLVWSEKILLEMREAIARNREDIPGETLDRMVAQMRSHFPEAECDGWEQLEESMTNHEKDRHVLAVAVAARADQLVTSNVKHFPGESCEPYGIEVVDPDEFLCRLFEVNQRTMCTIVEEMAADKRNPPMTVDEVIAAIARSAPTFAEELTHACRSESV